MVDFDHVILGYYMGLLKNYGEMPLPEDAYISNKNEVFIKRKSGLEWKKITIGKAIDSFDIHGRKMMIPNQNMARVMPDEFDEFYGDQVNRFRHYIAGPYAVCLRLAATSGLYQAVQSAFGVSDGNAFMDFAFMCNVKQSNAGYRIDSFLESHMHFSLNEVSSSSLSALMTTVPESKIAAFRIEWLKRYKCLFSNAEVWLSIDGSNHDCKSVGSAIAAKGAAKSGNSTNIIGQIWAIDAQTGVPVTWFVNDGNVPDCAALEQVIETLGKSEVRVRGVLLDRGFASKDIMNLINSHGYEYVIMLKGGCSGFEEMMNTHCNDIRRQVIHRVSNGGIYGITDHVKVFNTSPEKTKVGLFFSSINADERAEHFSDKVANEINNLLKAIESGAANPTPKDELCQILSVSKNESTGKPELKVNHSEWQKICDSKGFFAVACSDGVDIQELYKTYYLRDTSEKVFSQLKSQLGFDTLRGHSDTSILNRIAVSFIATVIRQLFISHCESVGAKPNLMLDKLLRIVISDDATGQLIPSYTNSKPVRAFLASVGVTRADFNDLATQMTLIAEDKTLSEGRTLNSLTLDKVYSLVEERYHAYISKKADKDQGISHTESISKEKKLSSPKAVTSTTKDLGKRKPGRPKGSKNKKTLEREAAKGVNQIQCFDNATNDVKGAPIKRGRGRPKGSKNKKTLAAEQGMTLDEYKESISSHLPKRKVGRPKGSLNKKTLAFQRMISAELEKEQRGRGRPNGSRNKKVSKTGGDSFM